MAKSETVAWYIEAMDRLKADKAAMVEEVREALYGEYCNCGLADANTLPNTHEFSCRYRVVMRRIEAGGE